MLIALDENTGLEIEWEISLIDDDVSRRPAV
jgi:hypothetical protein